MRREEKYLQRRVRVVAGVVLAGLLVFYTWFAFRDDARLMTVPGVPHEVWYYFDHHANIRNGVGFLMLGAVGAAAVTGLRPETQVLSLVLCLSAPLIKDLAQLFTLTRHFNWDATALGVVGGLVGFCLGHVVARCLTNRRLGASGDPSE